jgi:serine/threonine protein kinase
MPSLNDDLTEYASGGLAMIFRRQLSERAWEAQKVLLPKFRGRPEFEAALCREAEILASLDGCWVPEFFRLEEGSFAPDFEATPVLVMEGVDGLSVRALLQDEKFQWTAEILDQIARQLIAALHWLKVKDVIHGDLSPENILVSSEGEIKIIDFGVARRSHEERVRFDVAGKRRYRRDDRRASDLLDFSDDAYAASRILFEIQERVEGTQSSAWIAEAMSLLQGGTLPDDTFNTSLLKLDLSDEYFRQSVASSEREITLVLPSRSRWIQPGLRVAGSLAIFLCLTSFLSHRAYVSVNSLPPSWIRIHVGGKMWELETPVDSLPIPASDVKIQFLTPQKQVMGVHEVQVIPGDQVKVFEDLRKLDTLKRDQRSQ